MFCALHIKPNQINWTIAVLGEWSMNIPTNDLWSGHQTVHVSSPFCKTHNSNADSDMLISSFQLVTQQIHDAFQRPIKSNGVALDLQSLSLKRPLRRCLPPHTFLYVKNGLNIFTAYLRVRPFHYIKSNVWFGLGIRMEAR